MQLIAHIRPPLPPPYAGINSAIIKLGKLTKATKVFRGIAGMALPAEFWKQNECKSNTAAQPLPFSAVPLQHPPTLPLTALVTPPPHVLHRASWRQGRCGTSVHVYHAHPWCGDGICGG